MIYGQDSSSRRRRKAKIRAARKLKHGLLHLWPAAIRLTLSSQWITMNPDIGPTIRTGYFNLK